MSSFLSKSSVPCWQITPSLNRIRYEAPRDLRSRKVAGRYCRNKKDRIVVYYKIERMGEASPVDFPANDRKPKSREDA